jgi:hypothetical protein
MLTYQDCTQYLEPTYKMVGLNANPPDHSTDNGLLFTATMLVLLGQGGRDTLAEQFMDLTIRCEVRPGLPARYPADTGLNRQDDLYGICAASALFSGAHRGALAQRVLAWGEQHNYCWNVPNPTEWTLDGWVGRFPGAIAFMRACAGRALTLTEQLSICVALLGVFKEKREETSGKCLMYLWSRALWGKHLLVDAVIILWRWRMKRLFPGGLRELYSIYFQDPNHPFRLHAPTEFSLK